MNDDDIFQKLSSVVCKIIGMEVKPTNSKMIRSKISQRAKEAGFTSLSEYFEFYKLNRSVETKSLISVLTTHHTFFFRESGQFDFIKKNFDVLIKNLKVQGRTTINIWSVAASEGQEIYSLAMFFDYHLKAYGGKFTYKIWGTDVDESCIQIAKNGVYFKKDLYKVPAHYLSSHWQSGKAHLQNYVKVKSSLKDKCTFGVLNLLELESKAPKNEKFDYIFCRNVFIYFSQPVMEKIFRGLSDRLYDTGYVMLGISESVEGKKLMMENLGNSVYRKMVTHDSAALSDQYNRQRVDHRSDVGSSDIVQDKIKTRVYCAGLDSYLLSIEKAVSGYDDMQLILFKSVDDFFEAEMKFSGVLIIGNEFLNDSRFSSLSDKIFSIIIFLNHGENLNSMCMNPGHERFVDAIRVEESSDPDIGSLIDHLSYQVYSASLNHKKGKLSPVISGVNEKVLLIQIDMKNLMFLKRVLHFFQAPFPPVVILINEHFGLLGNLTSVIESMTPFKVELLSGDQDELFPNRVYLVDFKDFSMLSTMVVRKQVIHLIAPFAGRDEKSEISTLKPDLVIRLQDKRTWIAESNGLVVNDNFSEQDITELLFKYLLHSGD